MSGDLTEKDRRRATGDMQGRIYRHAVTAAGAGYMATMEAEPVPEAEGQ